MAALFNFARAGDLGLAYARHQFPSSIIQARKGLRPLNPKQVELGV